MDKRLVTREIFKDVSAHLKEREVTVVTGARQTGKTTLLLQLKEWLINSCGIKETQILFFNLDLINDFTNLQSQGDFIKYLREEIAQHKFLYVFIDEVQRLTDPGRFLKGIYDIKLPVKIIVSGSSSLEIRSRVSESLTGRKRIFHLWPFSFSEYISHYAPTLTNPLNRDDMSGVNKRKIIEHMHDFLVFGGYPRLVSAKNNEDRMAILNEIYSSYIEKDIVGFMKVKSPIAFSKMVALLGDQIGGLVNLHEISATLGLNFRTAENYLFALENTFVINLARPYFTNARKELTKMPKVYFADPGLRNLAVKYFAPFSENRDKGKLLENFVAASLVRQPQTAVNYWRTKDKAEVDFILKDYHGHITPIEVKAAELNSPDITKGLRAFIDKYKPSKAIVVNLSLEKNVKLSYTRVNFILPYSLEHLLQSSSK
ncbi:MAG: ATP-binding protein [Candidatus Omnitrophota bacterium]